MAVVRTRYGDETGSSYAGIVDPPNYSRDFSDLVGFLGAGREQTVHSTAGAIARAAETPYCTTRDDGDTDYSILDRVARGFRRLGAAVMLIIWER